MWERLSGQERAAETLRRAAARPVQAYLLVGSRRAGADVAARCFAAELIGADPERGQPLVLRGAHPDVVEFEPTTNTYTLANEVREPRSKDSYRRDRTLPRVIPEIHKAPIEGERKVVVLHAADRMDDAVANALLKSIEEPPPRTVVVLVTDRPDAMLATVRSRCQRVDLDYASAAHPEAAARVRAAFASAAARVDGTGANALVLADELKSVIDEAAATQEAAAAQELEELAAQIERAGYSARAAQGLRKRVVERQAQEKRRARLDALAEGLAGLEHAYLRSLTDECDWRVDPHGAGLAVDACRDARESFEFNPNEALLLERLVLHLPVPGTAPAGRR